MLEPSEIASLQQDKRQTLAEGMAIMRRQVSEPARKVG